MPEAFASRNKSVLSLVWRPEIKLDTIITPGKTIADIQWDNNEREALITPNNCTGKISFLNRNIDFDNLCYPPPVYLLKI